MNLYIKRCYHSAIALTMVVLVVSGCSSSSETTVVDSEVVDSEVEDFAVEEQSDIEIAGSSTVMPVDAADAQSPAESEPLIADDDNGDNAINDSGQGLVTDNNSGTTSDETMQISTPADSAQVVPNLLPPQSVQVDFDITVPAYSSDELQVQVTWGDVQKNAAWVGDEFWAVSLDFPLDTQNDLVITFSDKNGDVTLASHESAYKTGFNSAESNQVFADQFDSQRWDTDGDGISNLDESILGGDSVQLELRDAYFEFAIDFEVDNYEKQVPDERPYYELVNVIPDTTGRPEWLSPRWGFTRNATVDIDEAGSGTYEETNENYAGGNDITTWRYAATRTNTDDSVDWNGEHSRYHSDGVTTTHTVSVEASRVNEQVRAVDGRYHFRFNGNSPTSVSRYDYTLTGEPIADSTACEPTAGTLTHQKTSWNGQDRVWVKIVNTIVKSEDDQFWTVIETALESEDYPGGPETDIDEPLTSAEIIDTYLTRTLGATFYCDYLELR